MKVYINQAKIKRRGTVANIASLGGLMLLLAGVVLPLFMTSMARLSQVMMVAGLGISMVGIYYANRWVRKPRPEDSLGKALKSLNDSYHLYHYPTLPCDHVLLAPEGVVVIETINLAGDFTYIGGRWKEKMSFGRAMRYIVEEHLGDPVKAASEIETYLSGRFAQLTGPGQAVPVKSVVTFTHPAVKLRVDQAQIPVCKVDKLRKQVQGRGAKLPPQIYEALSKFLEDATNQG
jgi:hypothetical protein